MKKLLCLVFILIALLGLTFAVSAVDAEKLTGLADVSKLYESNGNEINGGGMNGGSYMQSMFDGSYGGLYNNGAGRYVVTDLNAKLTGGYHVTEVKVYHAGNSKYSLYYTVDGVTWTPIVEQCGDGTRTFAVNTVVTGVKYVFDTVVSWTQSVQEIEVYGIDPSELSCLHPNLSDDAWVDVPNSATCTKIGKQSQACPDCGEVFERESADIPALGHDLYINVTKPGTSVSYGEGVIKCNRCDYGFEFKGEFDLTSDDYATYDSRTNKLLTIAPSSIGHQEWGSKAEYLTDGVTDVIGWGQWYASTEDDANEYVSFDFLKMHDLTKVDVWVANDANGTLVISYLNAEGVYEVYKEIPTYDESLNTYDPLKISTSLLGITTTSIRFQVFSNTLKQDGFVYRKMMIAEIDLYGTAPGCGLDANNHECVYDIFNGYKVAPTCQTAGTAIYKCACNNQETREVQPSEEFHNFIEVEGTRVNSTCTVAGSYTGECEYCEAVKEEIPLELDTENGHEFEETSRKDADCENAGKIVYTCANCKATKEEEIPAKGHAFTETGRTDADCKNAGKIEFDCDNCDETKTEEIPVKDHTWVLDDDSIEVEPTCGGEGEGEYYCSECSARKKAKIPATGEHTWDEENVEITLNPTCEGSGAAQFSCAYCSAKEKRVIKALGHDFSVEVEGSREEATCTTDGKYEVTCANGCGKSQTKTIAALDHDWAEATCAAPKTCKRENCGATEGDPSTEHAWTAASCTAPRTCSVCSETDGEALGHTYGWKIPVKNEAGEVIKTISHGCSVCYLEPVKDKDDAGNELNTSSNLGFKILYVSDWSGLFDNLYEVKDEVDFDVIRLTSPTNMSGTKAITVYVPVIIDLGGNTITSPSNANWSMFSLSRTVAFGNGKLEHYGQSSQAIKTKNVDKIADLEIEVKATSGTVGGITSFSSYDGKECIGELTNVKIWGSGLTNHGIEAKNSGTTIGKMTNVYIESKGQAMTINNNVSFGEMVDCTFKGGNIALDFGNLYGEFKMTRCTVHGGYITIKIANASTDAKFTVTSDSTFTADNMLFDITDAAKANAELTLLETTVASVNGKLYDKIDNALEALKNSKEEVTTFALMANLELKSSIVINKAVNFSLGGGVYYTVATGGVVREPHYADGYTITIADDTVGNGVFLVMPTGKLTLSGAGVVNAVCNSSNELDIAVWVYGGEAIINGNTFTNEGAGDDDQYDLIYVNNGGKLTINDGTFKCATPKWTLNMGDNSNSEIVVNGGIFYGYNPAEAYTEPNSPVSFVSDEIVCVYINEDGAYALATEHDYDHDRYTEDKECDEVRTGPTCTEWGYMTHTCRCGEYRIETLTDNNNKPLGHTEAAAVQENINNATCSAAGSYDSVVYCSVCNAEISRETLTIDALPHTEETIPAVDATCTSTGLTAGTKCSVCGKTLVAQTEVEMLDHNYVPVENEDGSTTYTCQNGCNDSYVINNAAINGTYYDDTDAEYVFANGKLTAMDSEFTYTYNVTTGMVELQETTKVYFFVINGTLCSRTRMPLHKHDKSSLIKEITAPTCTEKGYATYICPISGPLFNDDYVDATGHSYNSMKIEPPTCTEDGYLQITCRTCKKTFVSPSPETDAYIDSQPSYITITIKPATGHTAAEAVREKVQNATCTAAGSYESVVYCSVCNAELSRTPETITALGHTAGEEVIENNKPATSTTAGSYDKVVYCVTCKEELSRETVTVKPTCAHTNTEIIPAVPGELRNPGMTSGVKCADCDAILVAPVQASGDFRFAAVTLSLSDNINIVYKVQVPEGYDNVYVVFNMNGVATPVEEYDIESTTGRYVFTFEGLKLQFMADLVTATVYAEKDGVISANSYSNYSVKSYIVKELGKTANSAKLKTMLSDLLILGDKAQMMKNYKTDNLMSADVAAELLTPSKYDGVPGEAFVQKMDINDEATRSIADWKSVTLIVENDLTMQFKLAIDKSLIDNIRIEVEVPSPIGSTEKKVYTKKHLSYSASEDRYILLVDGIKVIQYGQTVKGNIYYNDGTGYKLISRTVNYSVNSYAQRNQDSTNSNLREFIRALYLYGESAYKYATNK